MTLIEVIKDQTARSIWSLTNVIACVSDEYWNTEYCGMPFWKHIYHTIHSLDRWYINPAKYSEPDFHVDNLNNLDVQIDKSLTRCEIEDYLNHVSEKIMGYLSCLSDEILTEKPCECNYSKFQLILAQHRHLDMHIGMMMGFIISDTGQWPRVMGLESDFIENQSLFY